MNATESQVAMARGRRRSRGGERVGRWLPSGLSLVWLALFLGIWGGVLGTQAASLPNIVLIYADDLGYGDLGCYGAKALATPHLDRFASEGLRFTDAHSSAATCTPSRYSLMTGEYAWRKKGTGVLPGDAALILDPARTTLPGLLRKAGYTTGVVGKWHLGMGPGPGKTDWNGQIRPGPLEVGFDESFVMPATGDRVPCVYVDGRGVVGLETNDPIRVSFSGPIGEEPTGKSRPDLLRVSPSHGHDMTIVDGISRIGYMSGGRAARWVDAEMGDRFADRAVAFLEKHRARRFFLYFATHDIHVPRVPQARFAGKSGMGPRGDVILQFDEAVGRILGTLDRLGLRENTLVMVTSDNGPVVDDGYRDDAVAKLGAHRPAGPWRGGKYSAFEGGTRVPFLVRWPGRVRPGTSDALVCQIDFLASFAALTGQPLEAGVGPDSVDVMPSLLGDSRTGRTELVVQAGALSLRQGAWKYIEPGKGPKFNAPTATETGQDPAGQLYDLSSDPGETNNLVSVQAERTAAMVVRLKQLRESNP